MKFWFINILVVFGFLISVELSAREIRILGKDWRFVNKEIDGGEKKSLDDSAWEQVTVPHDWAINKAFDMSLDIQWIKVNEDKETKPKLRTGRTGALPAFGVGWYRINIPISSDDAGKRFFIEFDGAMSNANVYLNEHFIGHWPYGYTSFYFDITDKVIFGTDNLLAIRLENKTESSRWYTGAGLYRQVRLVSTHPVYTVKDGTFITTPFISSKKAIISVSTEIENKANQNLIFQTDIINPQGKIVASERTNVEKNSSTPVQQKITVLSPQYWSVNDCKLYKAISRIFVNNIEVDTNEHLFGIRHVVFHPEKGLLVNNKSVQIKGVCMHHDLGPLGAAINIRALERQLEILKEMGCNAIRTSHNPPAPELLQLADRMGFLMQVEAFDEWRIPKNKNGYSQHFDLWAERDLSTMIRRDRNHPSVIMWSIGNEIRDQLKPEGAQTAQMLTDICHHNDPTRPVTAGMNNIDLGIKNGWHQILDLVGFNYRPDAYAKKHAEFPNKAIYGSETASTLSSRGVYHFPVKEISHGWTFDYQMSSFDLSYPNWANTPETDWLAIDDNPFVCGEFVWTGFDYLGEPTPYNEGTPSRSSYFGIVDLAGLKKDRFYLYQSRWSDKPVLHLLPHWSWPEREGLITPVYCYTNYPQVELFVNGKSMGKQTKNNTNKYTRYRLMWPEVIYRPGEIKVVAYDNEGNAVAEQRVKTAGTPYALRFTADRSSIQANGKDLCFVTVEIVDKEGNLCPNADNYIYLKTEGAGQLKALCNGDATCHTPLQSAFS